ncbi:sulfatase-like hydrolase/transferase [Pseudonocardia sp.]|uniref:sulfatase-like hydrolase/transferase n=1 Tax=Pseudonocardia sp. TaxID=60912 RepID=UPI0026026C34|nr:sulfatase-like hydrolase/transferase [Pseudonocardia sp.]
MTRLRTAAAVLLVAGALLVPRGGEPFTAAAFVRIPLEALAGIVLLVLLPARARDAVAVGLGALLGLLTVLGVVDRGFRTALGRPFDPVVDTVLLADAATFVSGSYGPGAALAATVGAAVLAVAVPVLLALAVRHLGRVLAPHRPVALRTAAGLAPVWLACALLGVQLVPGVAVASASITGQVGSTLAASWASVLDQRQFAAQVGVDAFADTPDAELLTALRGKDVVVAFVESYGRDAVTDPEFAPQIGAVLDDGTQRLAVDGFAARSGYLTSPIVGGGSWLAHATFHSGLPVTNQSRYRTLMASERRSLPGMFTDVGASTAAVMPGTAGPWPEGAFYRYDRIIDFDALDYRGPDLGWATVPDQYTLSAFQRLTAAAGPQMAEIALVTSHAPWPFVPPLLDWAEIGDGSVYEALAPAGPRPTDLSRTEYRRSVEYSLSALISYVETYGDDDLVLVLLGDHQPLPVITGEGAGRDVPISIVTRDPAVLDRIAGWDWDEGLRPGERAPVWPMESFRDRFLTAFGPDGAAPTD